MGSDYYESHASITENEVSGRPRIGIGQNVHIANAIIDKNARIGDDVTITPDGKPADMDDPLYCIRDGIVIIPKGGVIPPGLTCRGLLRSPWAAGLVLSAPATM